MMNSLSPHCSKIHLYFQFFSADKILNFLFIFGIFISTTNVFKVINTDFSTVYFSLLLYYLSYEKKSILSIFLFYLVSYMDLINGNYEFCSQLISEST